MLITEGLAELKTLIKRIESKREYVRAYLFRPDGLRDPLEKDGGSARVIEREMQAIGDLNANIVRIRTAIQATNLHRTLTVGGTTRTIAEWLTWRKEVSEGEQNFNRQIRLSLNQARTQALQRGNAVVPVGSTPSSSTDLLVNVDEGALSREAESLETILGTLDGQLSLLNATVAIEGI